MIAIHDAGVAAMLNKLLRAAQAREPAMARGLMVWLHSVRAEPNARDTAAGARDVGLRRGIPYARTAADNLELLIGLRLQVVGVERVPVNLDPDTAARPAA